MESTPPFAADILIVEDDEVFRLKCAEALTNAGYSCETAENGLKGLQRCLQSRYRLLITDLEMPSLHGWGLIARLRATQSLNSMPIITMTGHRERELVAKVVAMGVQAFLLKSFEYETLIDTVEHLLHSKTKIYPFANCPKCLKEWPALVDFLGDEEINPTGFQVVIRDVLKGNILFSHAICGTEFPIEVKSFIKPAPKNPSSEEVLHPINGYFLHDAAQENPLTLEILKQMLNWE